MRVDTNEEPGDEKIRQYEAVVELATRSRDPLDEQARQKIEELIQDVNSSEDLVYRVNCLQIVADLACSKQALAILEERKVPARLIEFLNESDPLIVPHALKFFYRINPQDLELKFPQVLDKICDYCQSDDKQLADYAVDIIAAIGRGGLSARKVLDNHPQFKEKCLVKLGSILICSDTLLKSRTLKCVFDLLELQEEDSQEESSILSERFYHAIIAGEQKMTNQLLTLCRIPIMEIRINSMLVVSAVSVFEWAQKELAAHPNFVKWILDRSSETCKESKEAKFEILRTIVRSLSASRVFKSEDYMKMRADLKNGPFHVGIAEEMLMDNQQAS